MKGFIMPLPTRIKVGYADYKVRHVSKKTKSKELKDLGECDYINQTITLFGKQAPSELLNSTWHEALHSAILAFNVPFKTTKEEEKYVNHFTNLTITLFRDNPKLLEYFQEVLTKTDN